MPKIHIEQNKFKILKINVPKHIKKLHTTISKDNLNTEIEPNKKVYTDLSKKLDATISSEHSEYGNLNTEIESNKKAYMDLSKKLDATISEENNHYDNLNTEIESNKKAYMDLSTEIFNMKKVHSIAFFTLNGVTPIEWDGKDYTNQCFRIDANELIGGNHLIRGILQHTLTDVIIFMKKYNPGSYLDPNNGTWVNGPINGPINVNDSEFISKWVTESLNEEIQLPFFENNIIDIIIDWGDNVIEMKTTENVISKTPPTGESNIKHTYVNPGTYMIKIYGTIDKFSFQYPNYVSRNKIMSIENWGRTMMKKADLQYTNSPYIRKISGNFNPELNDLSKFFAYTTIEIPDTSNWDVSRVTNMSDMFRKTLIANPNTSKWDVSRVTNMSGMFENAYRANPDVSNWDVSRVTNMSNMFQGTLMANPTTTNWNMSNVTNIGLMFQLSKNASPDVSKWDVSRVTNMCGTFSGSEVANPDVSNWDVSGVTNMYSMFGNAKVANPNVSNWNVSGVTNIKNMFVNSALSTTNYDNLLKGWSSLPTITSNLIFTASTNPYTISISQKNKDKLINSPNNWVIYDEGGV